jgi:small basic protein
MGADNSQRFKKTPLAWAAVLLLVFWIGLSFSEWLPGFQLNRLEIHELVLVALAICTMMGIVFAKPWGWFSTLIFVSGFTLVIAVQLVTLLIDSGIDRVVVLQTMSFGLCCLLLFRLYRDHRVRLYFGVNIGSGARL